MNDEQALKLRNQLRDLVKRRKYNKLAYYEPLVKNGVSRQMEFHDKTRLYTETCFGAGNQLGKTYAGAAQAAIWLTGRYPDWWQGRVWDRPVTGWVSGVTGESTRDTVQRLLMGKKSEGLGTGLIPADCLDRDKITLARGVSDLYDTVLVKHKSGGWSELKFKSYERGREKWQGDTLDFIWFDEEPPDDIYEEGLARITDTKGLVYLTFTPLKGITQVVGKFYDEPERPRLTIMRIDESPRFTEKDIEDQKKKYPKHQWACRLYGEPVQGEGAVFTYLQDDITIDDFALPEFWAYLWGLDFGVGHPFAAVLLAHDRDTDTVYVTRCIRMKDALPLQHCSAMKSSFGNRGNLIPAAWPQDGEQRKEFEGQLTPQRKIYAKHGQKMLDTHAKFEDGSNSTELGIQLMSERFSTGRLKVFRSCVDWFQEYGRYHRKDGLLVKVNDDLLSGTRVGIMMLRKAKPFDLLVDASMGASKPAKMARGANPVWWE